MPLSPSLWDAVDPPAVWITLDPPLSPEADARLCTLRVKEGNKRSITAQVAVTRYAPEWSILRAMCETVAALAILQKPLTKEEMTSTLKAMAVRWVEPF